MQSGHNLDPDLDKQIAYSALQPKRTRGLHVHKAPLTKKRSIKVIWQLLDSAIWVYGGSSHLLHGEFQGRRRMEATPVHLPWLPRPGLALPGHTAAYNTKYSKPGVNNFSQQNF